MDDDDKKSDDAAAEPARDAAQDEGAKLREVSEEDLKPILAAHETWVETDGEKGEQADLSRTDLQGANLQGAYLTGADLRGANLAQVNFEGDESWNLPGAELSHADLRDANLGSAQNLTREQLDEACGDDKTKLPVNLADYQMKACPTPEQPPSN